MCTNASRHVRCRPQLVSRWAARTSNMQWSNDAEYQRSSYSCSLFYIHWTVRKKLLKPKITVFCLLPRKSRRVERHFSWTMDQRSCDALLHPPPPATAGWHGGNTSAKFGHSVRVMVTCTPPTPRCQCHNMGLYSDEWHCTGRCSGHVIFMQ